MQGVSVLAVGPTSDLPFFDSPKPVPSHLKVLAGYEVSAKTIQRDIDFMRFELNAPLEYSAKERGYYYTEEQFQLPAMEIRESDLFAIYLADKLLAQYEGTPIHDSLRSVFRKIENALPDSALARFGGQDRFTVVPPYATVILPEVLVTVFDGLRTSNRLEIFYNSPTGEPAWRRVDPYHGVRFAGEWYLVGHCQLRNDIRTFGLARIASARKLAERFTLPDWFDFSRLSGSHFGVHWGSEETEVRIRFVLAAAFYVRERRWHASQEIEEEADGSLVLALTVNHLLELRRWILSWGDMAQVLAPASLAAEIGAIARRMADPKSRGEPAVP